MCLEMGGINPSLFYHLIAVIYHLRISAIPLFAKIR